MSYNNDMKVENELSYFHIQNQSHNYYIMRRLPGAIKTLPTESILGLRKREKG